jgi:REP element-mobilizing transposase RayT
MRRNMLVIKILGKFQQQTSKQINIMRNTPGTKNWQRDFYDHVIRNNEEYVRIKEYIIKNPQNWENDRFMGT